MSARFPAKAVVVEYKIETYPPYPTGGQHVGMTSSGVKVTHIPSGLMATATSERSQHRNKQVAMHMIEGGLTSPFFRG
jgi:peptide chain release factor 2